MIQRKQVETLIDQKLEGTELFLVNLKISPANRIEVFIDGMNGLSIKDCVNLSRHIESSLDREAEDFELLVSSPGADEPFLVQKQYQKNIGKNVSVTTREGKVVTGTLTGVAENAITIQSTERKPKEKGKGKILVTEEIVLDTAEIKETKRILSFK